MTVTLKWLRGILWVLIACLGLSLFSCTLATGGESDLPLEEWVVTSAYVAYADSTKTTYSTHVAINYADSSSASGAYSDDYAGTKATNVSTLYSISSGSFAGTDLNFFVLASPPDPATNPVVTFDTNHYFYRIDNSSTFRKTVAKCHFKTASIPVTFEQ